MAPELSWMRQKMLLFLTIKHLRLQQCGIALEEFL